MDNSATTRCSERAKNKMVQILTEDYGNPSSLHNMGKTAEDYIKEAKEQIAKTLRCDEKEIVFTSGGTESNNMALIGGALANKRQGKHIITTAIEHASVQAPLAYLKELGYEITELSVDHDGIISLEELRDAVREDTVLVSIMMVNNEIGAVEPVEEAAKVIKAKNPDTLFHVDAIQAYGKFRMRASFPYFFSFSSIKFRLNASNFCCVPIVLSPFCSASVIFTVSIRAFSRSRCWESTSKCSCNAR